MAPATALTSRMCSVTRPSPAVCFETATLQQGQARNPGQARTIIHRPRPSPFPRPLGQPEHVIPARQRNVAPVPVFSLPVNRSRTARQPNIAPAPSRSTLSTSAPLLGYRARPLVHARPVNRSSRSPRSSPHPLSPLPVNRSYCPTRPRSLLLHPDSVLVASLSPLSFPIPSPDRLVLFSSLVKRGHIIALGCLSPALNGTPQTLATQLLGTLLWCVG